MFKPITNFTGGLNKFVPAKFLRSNEAQELRNADIRHGDIRSRKKHLLANESVGGYYIRNFHADSGINHWFTHNKPLLYVDFLRRVYYSAPNSLETISKYYPDGTPAGNIGIANPTAHPSAVENTSTPGFFSAGEIVLYVYTVVGEAVETAPSPVGSVTVQNEGSSVDVTTPLASDLGGNKIRLYRAGGGAGDYLLVTEFDGGTFNDNLTGGELGYAVDTWGNEPPPYGLILDCYFKGFFVGHVIGSSELRFSNPTNVESWNPLHMIRFDSPIMTVIPFAGTLVVFCESEIYQLVGENIQSFVKSEIPTEQTLVSVKSVVKGDGGLFFQSNDGLCVFDGANVKVFTKPKLPRSYFAGRELVAASYNGAFYFGDENGLLVVDTDFGGQFYEVDSISGLTDLFYNKADDKLYLGTLNGIYQLESAADYATLTYRSGNLGNGIEDPQGSDIVLKHFRTVRVTGAGSFTIQLFVDEQLVASYIETLDPLTPTTLWFTRASRGYSAQVEFQGTGTVTSMTVEYYPEGVDSNG